MAERAGLPKGVLNMVTGSGSEVGDEMVANNKTGLVTMTGSTEAGKKIMVSAASHVSKVILELGGKAPPHRMGRCRFRLGAEMCDLGEILELRPNLHLRRAHVH